MIRGASYIRPLAYLLLGIAATGTVLMLGLFAVLIPGITPSIGLAFVGGLAALLVLALAALPLLMRSATLVELAETAVLFRAADGSVVANVPWGELRGYSDGFADHVRIVPRRLGWGPMLIPTATEKDRVEVLAWLDRHGVVRLE